MPKAAQRPSSPSVSSAEADGSRSDERMTVAEAAEAPLVVAPLVVRWRRALPSRARASS